MQYVFVQNVHQQSSTCRVGALIVFGTGTFIWHRYLCNEMCAEPGRCIEYYNLIYRSHKHTGPHIHRPYLLPKIALMFENTAPEGEMLKQNGTYTHFEVELWS